MRERFHKLMSTALTAVVVTGVVCATAFAADLPPISLEFKDVDVRSAIDTLFRGSGKSVAIDNDVQGTISVLSFKEVPWESALKGLAKAAGLTYRMDGEIYLIQKKQPVTETAAPVVTEAVEVEETATEETIIDKVPLSNTGATELLNMMNGNTNSNNGGSYGGFGGSNGGWGGNNSWGGGFGNMNSGFGNSGFGNSGFGNSGFGNFGGSNYGSSYGGSNYGSSYGRTW